MRNTKRIKVLLLTLLAASVSITFIVIGPGNKTDNEIKTAHQYTAQEYTSFNRESVENIPTEKIRWYNFNPVSMSNWSIKAIDQYQCEICSRKPEGKYKKILAVFQGKNENYDTKINSSEITLNKILDFFDKEQIQCLIRVVCFDANDLLKKKILCDTLNNEDGIYNEPDLIISIGSESTEFLYKMYKNRKIPVVTACSKDPVLLGLINDYNGSGNNFAFTSLNVPVDVQLKILNSIFSPEDGRGILKNIAVIYDRDNESAVRTQVRPMETETAHNDNNTGIGIIRVEAFGSMKKEEYKKRMLDAINSMKKNDSTLKGSIFWITGCTSLFKKIDIINLYAGKVPVLSTVPDVVKQGDDSAVMSIGISFENNACMAAKYAVDVLRGADPGKMKVGIISPPDISINFKKAKESGLKIPLDFIEMANQIFDYNGNLVRASGMNITSIKNYSEADTQ